jgi:hypothetical protein
VAWASPEVLQGGPADPRADLYSLGRLLHHLAGGAPPYDPDDPFGATRWLLRPAPLPPVPGLAPEMQRLVASLTHPCATRRPRCAEEVLASLAAPACAASTGPRPLPRGAIRALKASLRRVAGGGSATLIRTVPHRNVRERLLGRAAAEAVRAGLSPVRPVGRGGGPPAMADLGRALRMHARAAGALRCDRLLEACPGPEPAQLLLEIARAGRGPPALLLDGGDGRAAALSALARQVEAGRWPGPVLVLLVRGEGGHDPRAGPGKGRSAPL